MIRKELTGLQKKFAIELLNFPDGVSASVFHQKTGYNRKTSSVFFNSISKYGLVERRKTAIETGFEITFKPLPPLLEAIENGFYMVEHQMEEEQDTEAESTSLVERLRGIVSMLDEAGVPSRQGDEPILVERRIEILTEERDKAISTLKAFKEKTLGGIDPKRIKPILEALNTPAVRIILGRQPTIEDVIDKIVEAGISSISKSLGKK